MARKKMRLQKGAPLKPGTSVILKKVPPGFLDDLPEKDQRPSPQIAGLPVRHAGLDEDSRLELEFVEPNGTSHHIHVDRTFIKTKEPGSWKPTKRRK